jgi:hypothetical protein
MASYDNVYSLTPHRVVEFTFDSPEDAARYFGRKQIGLILQSDRLDYAGHPVSKTLGHAAVRARLAQTRSPADLDRQPAPSIGSRPT